jgi:hypothetical protein
MAKPKKQEYSYGVCGVFCEMCPTGNGRVAELASELSRITKGNCKWAQDSVDFQFDDMDKGIVWLSKIKCPGCQNIKEPWCEVMKCKKAKNLKSCLLCETFPTCKRNEYQRGRYPVLSKHHKRVKKVGLERHLKEERERTRKGLSLVDIRKY